MNNFQMLIKTQYENSRGDSTGLFQTILALAKDIGLQTALGYLEQCVTEKRLAWIDAHLGSLPRSDNTVQDAYHIFFERYLGVKVPQDGEIVEASPGRLVMRWWNECPTLNACTRLGLDTRLVCRASYQRPAEALLQRIDPHLHFARNYDAIRPYMPYCEETILLDDCSHPRHRR